MPLPNTPSSPSSSPTMPALISLREPSSLSLPASGANSTATAIGVDQQALIKLVTDVVTRKPGTKEEAIELFHSLQVQLGTWLVSELPALEQKAVLAGLWAVKEVELAMASGCFGLCKK